MTSGLAGETVYTLEKVSFGYEPDRLVLRDIDLTIRAGERVALLGANGCGKSTLQKILDGLLFPSSGRVAAFGEALTQERQSLAKTAYPFRRRVGYVFQNPETQLFSATVRDEVAFGPRQLLPMDEVDDRVRSLLELLDLPAWRTGLPIR